MSNRHDAPLRRFQHVGAAGAELLFLEETPGRLVSMVAGNSAGQGPRGLSTRAKELFGNPSDSSDAASLDSGRLRRSP